MKRILCFLLNTSVLAATTLAAEFKIDGYTFTLQDGFTIEKVAGPPLVNRPIECDFDEQGRLYVTDSSGSNENAQKQLEQKPHRIVRLEDTDGDGRFDKTALFADRLMFPEGILWHDGVVYCGAPPSIWKLEDTDGDGLADRRTEWFQGKTLTGCANDIHGPYLGPDGWIYWCKGAFAKQTYERPGLPTISDSAAHVFRQRPDGTMFDSVMSGGMDNPVEIAFMPGGDAIFTTTFYVNPAGGKRDALVHAIYGSVFPKVNGVLDGLKRTGELMPALTHLGPAAPCGLMRYESAVFGSDYQGNLFSSQFNLHKIQRHILEPDGGTFKSKDVDFLVCDIPDFHPTDVLEDADGTLLVVDTGGWYKLCCPTSQLAKPDVLGAIYRIRRKGAAPVVDPRGLKLPWNVDAAALVQRLEDARPAVQKRAMLALRKLKAVGPLRDAIRKGKTETAQLAAWTLAGIDSADARAASRLALKHRDPIVQQAAAHTAGLYRDTEALKALESLLEKGSPHVRRQAATALGQIGQKQAVSALVAAANEPIDRAFEHSLIYALIQIDDPPQTRGAVLAKRTVPSSAQRVGLIALDQMDNGGLRADDVIPFLGATDAKLKETANWIAAHHSDWAGALVAYISSRLREAPSDPEVPGQIAKYIQNPQMQSLVTAQLKDRSPGRANLLNVVADSNLKTVPKEWPSAIAEQMRDADENVARAAIRAARAVSRTNRTDSSIREAAYGIATDTRRGDDLRLEALGLLSSDLDDSLFKFAAAHLDSSHPPMQRINAASVLGKMTLSEEQLGQLANRLPEAGPLELTRLLSAFDGHATEDLGLKLVAGLKQSRVLTAVPADALKTRFAKYPESVQKSAAELMTVFNASAADKKKRLDEFEASLPAGDSHRGHLIFNGTKAACATCHAVGYLGGQVGPDLTRIGSIRTQRDLLEAILYPSASFVRSFEPMIVTTKDGEDHSGLIRKEASDSLVLVTGPAAEEKILRSDIKEIRPSTVSVMPEGLEQQLTRQEMSDLVAFLKALK
jgi:putative membrane-bound dehydrogenase-like protein